MLSRRLLIALSGMLALTGAGTLGYVVLEEAPLLDALYMTVVTLSTVGYREVVPLSSGGRAFTIALIVTGVTFALYSISVLGETLLAGTLRDVYRRRSMLRAIEHIHDHVIVCGFGRFGSIVAEHLRKSGRSLVVIESDEALEPTLADLGVPYVMGSATSDDVLKQAGIERAGAISIALSSESDCVFITLAARELNREILINARCESEAAVRRLRRAGANHVISPLQIGGARAAMSILRPTVVDFLELSSPLQGEEVYLEELVVQPGSPAAGKAVADLEEGHPRLRIVAVRHAAEPIQIMPEREARLAAGDQLVVIGLREDLAELAALAQGTT